VARDRLLEVCVEKARIDQFIVLVLAGFAGACAADSMSDTNGNGLVGTGGFQAMPSGGSGGQPAGIKTGSGGTTMTAGMMTGSGGRTGSSGMMTGSGGMTGKGGPMAGSGGSGGGDSTGDAGMGGGAAGMGGSGGTGVVMTDGMCCASGDCLCHGPDPTELTSSAGPFKVDSYDLSTGTVYYPTDADPPFAAIAICPGFLNVGPEMAPWGPFYASHGIVLIAASTGAADTPDIRATLLLGAIDELKAENMKSGSPLSGKLSGRYGTSGYSMGGGGTTIAAATDSTLKTSIGLAPWGGTGGQTVPTLVFCGDADTVAPCNMAQGVFDTIADSTPKMIMTVFGATHFNWFDPADAGGGLSGQYALAFEKLFLEGDERWKPLLLQKPTTGTPDTNIQ
jgi:dienelactone hydrolase